MYRYGYKEDVSISNKYPNHIVDLAFERKKVRTAEDLLAAIKEIVEESTAGGKTALALSGGIDSAILAKFMPEGSVAYTFRCVVPGTKVTDESERASYYADVCKLDHHILDIYWEDIERVIDDLMRHKGGPVHSIEAQIYLAALKAKEAGFENIIFGENADIIYGGMNGLLQKDWLFGEFVDRYCYVKPYHVLKDAEMPLEPFKEFCKDGHIDGHDFINKYFRQEALGTYNNACNTAGINFVGPYSMTVLDAPIDYDRVRSGDTKYVIREAFKILYPDYKAPDKIPMPRPVNEWFANWEGPKREEFLPHCTDEMTGDQKWMVWCAERYLNLLEEK
ncbi:MAG: asparagine synthase [Mogibacterium sp.]|nr:asparagine synthase [Mogibacterium sp.]